MTTPTVVSPAPRAVWRDVFDADPDAVATQAPEWADCLTARGYTDASRLYALPDGRRLVLPLVARRRAGLPLTEESWPYGWGYGGLLSERHAPTAEDCALVLADLARRPAVLRAVTPTPTRGAPWLAAAPAGARTVPYTAQLVDLAGGFDAVWTRYRRQARNAVRKAERFELDVRREDGTTADPRGIEVFRELYARSVDRWATQRGQPLALARALAARRDRPGQVALAAGALGRRCVVWSVLRAGEPVAANVVLQHGTQAVGWLCAMDADLARETLATYLLHSVAIADACAAGVRWFHMGESESGSGGEHFKRYFGAVPVEYAAIRLERLPLAAAERRARTAYAGLSAAAGRLRSRSVPKARECSRPLVAAP